MFKAPGSVTAIMAYIPEITWDRDTESVSLLQVYQTLCDLLRPSADGMFTPRQGARGLALWSAKALLHLYVQRRCICPKDKSLLDQVKFIDRQKPQKPLGPHGFDRDYDGLASTFYIIDWTLGTQP